MPSRESGNAGSQPSSLRSFAFDVRADRVTVMIGPVPAASLATVTGMRRGRPTPSAAAARPAASP